MISRTRRSRRPGRTLAWTAACLASLCACWATPVSLEDPQAEFQKPAGPGGVTPIESDPPTPASDPTPGDSQSPPVVGLDDPPFAPLAATTMQLSGGLMGIARRVTNPPRDLAIVRLTLPVGTRHGQRGLARLTARSVVDLADEAGSRPSLRREIAEIGGDLDLRIGASVTVFEVTVSHRRWQEALAALARGLRRTPGSREGLRRVQVQLARDERRELSSPSADRLVRYVLQGRRGNASAYLAGIEDASLDEVALFHRFHYGPRGAVLALWVPGPAPDSLLASARTLVEDWAGDEEVPTTERSPEPPINEGILWSAGPGQSVATILLPFPAIGDVTAAEHLLMLESMTMSGAGGRLGSQLRELGAGAHILQNRVVTDGARRYLALSATVEPTDVPGLWQAVLKARRSLYNTPPRRDELRGAIDRVRLRLIADYAEPSAWLDVAVGNVLAGAGDVELEATLRELKRLENGDLSQSFRELLNQPTTMIVLGGTPVTDATAGIALLEEAFLDSAPVAVPLSSAERKKAALPFVALALRAVGGGERLRQVHGYAGVLRRQAPLGPSVGERHWFSGTHYRRLSRVLATEIETVAGPQIAVERAGSRTIELSESEQRALLAAAARHPLLLLGACARDEVSFALVSRRRVDDRDMAVLERIDPSRERLRMHVDTESGLVRVIETDEWREGVGRVHIREEFDDYRTIEGFRTPFHSTVTVGDARTPLDSEWQQFTVQTPPDAALELGGPTEFK